MSKADEGKTGNEFVRNANHKDAGDSFSLGHAFSCAWSGIINVIRTQRNMKIHLVIAAVAIVLGFVLSIDAPSWAAIIICIALVLALECVNTALEAVVDLVSPNYSDLARRAKDCAAGAVFICAIGSVVVGIVIFVPRVLVLIGLI